MRINEWGGVKDMGRKVMDTGQLWQSSVCLLESSTGLLWDDRLHTFTLLL